MTKEEIDKAKQNIFINSSKVLPEVQLNELMRQLNELSDEEFEIFAKRVMPNSSTTDKEYLENTFQYKKDNKYFEVEVEGEGVELTNKPPLLPKKENDTLLENIKRKYPSDEIFIDDEVEKRLEGFWHNDSVKGVPSDLFFAHTIPLLNFTAHVKFTKDNFTAHYTYIIYDNYIELADASAATETAIIIGAVIVNYKSDRNGKEVRDLILPISICGGIDYTIGCGLAYDNTDYGIKVSKHYQEKFNKLEYMTYTFAVMALWYGIEISMLHPQLVDIYSKPIVDRVYNKNYDKKKGGKNKTRIVRKYKITNRIIDESLSNTPREFERKTLVWHVAGHWRHYNKEDSEGNKKKTFVQPYWKGPLKQVKRNLDNGRIREIDIPEE